MLLRSGRTKNQMVNNKQVEPEQENLNFEKARGLPSPEINLPIPEISKSANPQPDGGETFQIDYFLEDNKQFLVEANELLRHYDEQVIREREKFIREIENKNKSINRTAKPTAHSSFEKEFRNHEKSNREKMGNINEILNKQSVNLRNRRMNVHKNLYTDDNESLETEENINQNRTRRATTCNRSSRRSRANQGNQETEDNSELSDYDDYHPRRTTHFPFGMTQTPFQIMSNWPIKFRNNKEDSTVHFSIMNLLRNKKKKKFEKNLLISKVPCIWRITQIHMCYVRIT